MLDMQNINEQSGTCPCCNYCKHCGRSNRNIPYIYPNYPYPNYPILSPVIIGDTTGKLGNMDSINNDTKWYYSMV